MDRKGAATAACAPTLSEEGREVKSPVERLEWLMALKRADYDALVAHLPAGRRPAKSAVIAVATAMATDARDKTGRCWSGLGTLGRDAGVARSTAQLVRRALAHGQWIDMEQRLRGGRQAEADTNMCQLRMPDSGIGVPEPGIGVPDQAGEVCRNPAPKEESKEEFKGHVRARESDAAALRYRDSLPPDERARQYLRHRVGARGHRTPADPRVWREAMAEVEAPT